METEKPNEKGELCPKQAIYIVVEDGRIQAVYANCPLAQIDVEILDLDEAKVSDDKVLESMRQSIAEVERRCAKIY